MKHTLLLCLLLATARIASAQVYDSAVRYRNASLFFNVAMDTFIQRATAANPIDTGEGSEANALARFKEFMRENAEICQ